jgi:multidrug resistance efflux pump
MSSPFRHTQRALAADGQRGVLLGFGLAGLLALAWLAWFLLARVPVKVVSAEARLEAVDQVHTLQVEVAGRVAELLVEPGATVEEGEILVVLASTELAQQVAAAQGEERALRARLESCGIALEAQEQSLALARQARMAADAEARAHVDEARASATVAAEDAARVDRLHAERSISEMEMLEVRAEAQRTAAALDASAQGPARAAWEVEREVSGLVSEVEELRAECAGIDGALASQQATIATLDRELERHRVRAPKAGQIVELAALSPGTVVSAGERLGALLPQGDLRLVAWFEPGHSLGRIQPGQPAVFRADAFPWIEHGSQAALVTRVAGELREGRLRADLEPLDPQAASFPLQHGLTGSVEVEVERVSPARLVLRAAGSRLAAPAGEAAR